MNSGFLDSNNHVPELAPDDDWCDSDDNAVSQTGPVSSLPPRRSVSDSLPAESPKIVPGLRIDSRVKRDNPSGSSKRLEVQEISSQVVRLEQEAPAPPRVERVVTFRARPAGVKEPRNTRGEGKEWGRVHRHSPRWILAMSGTVLVLVILGMVLLPGINAPNAARENPRNSIPMIDRNETPEGVDALNRLVLRQAEAVRIYRSFLQAAHPDEVFPLIRDGPALKEALRERWQAMGISSEWAPAKDASWLVLDLEGHPCAMLAGRLPDNSKFTAYFTAAHEQLLLDWKATTAYGTATYEELESGHGDGREIRGEISIIEFHTHAFPEENYQSFRLVSPDGQSLIWCYASRKSTAYPRIASQLQAGEIIQDAPDSLKVTLRLVRGSDTALPNQWLIDEFLHFDWVSP